MWVKRVSEKRGERVRITARQDARRRRLAEMKYKWVLADGSFIVVHHNPTSAAAL